MAATKVKTKAASAAAKNPPPMDERTLIEELRSTRAGYDEEKVWHRFLLDAFAGTGGFAGRTRMPFAGFWGSAAEAYSEVSSALGRYTTDESKLNTYLDRYPREDMKKFEKRVAIAHYANHVEPTVDLRLSFMARKPFNYEGVEELFEGEDAWALDVGNGLPWDRFQHEIVRLRAMLLGWCPVVADQVNVAPGTSVAQAESEGVRPELTALYPANLLDWQCDRRGKFVWAKIRTSWVERPIAIGSAVRVDRIVVWYADRSDVYEIETDAKTNKERLRVATPGIAHEWGRVPVIIYRAKPAPDDAVMGLSPVGTIAQLCRRIFNYTSELDEHLRASTFAFLQVPTKTMPANGSISLGSGNALPIPHDSTRDYKWIGPDVGVAEVYEARLEAMTELVNRIARTRASSGVAKESASGVAQAYEFEDQNRAIADTAAMFAASEQETLRLVAVMKGRTTDEGTIRVTAHARYDVEELSKSIADTIELTTVELGITATAEIKKRLVRQALPNLDEDMLSIIDDEIDTREQEREIQAAAEEEAMIEAMRNPAPQEGAEPGEEGAPPPKGGEPKGPPNKPAPGRPPARRGARGKTPPKR